MPRSKTQGYIIIRVKKFPYGLWEKFLATR